MRIVSRKKIIIRIIEAFVIIATIILTILAIKYATAVRGYKAFGGEYLISIINLMMIFILEEYLESEEKNDKKSKR